MWTYTYIHIVFICYILQYEKKKTFLYQGIMVFLVMVLEDFGGGVMVMAEGLHQDKLIMRD